MTVLVNKITSSDACKVILESSQKDADGCNAARLALGSLVAEELRSLARYNIDPGSLPGGTDPVEYFLGENRQGGLWPKWQYTGELCGTWWTGDGGSGSDKLVDHILADTPPGRLAADNLV